MKLATIERIREILPHPGADRLELTRVLGWQCVVKKGEFQPGDRVVFVAIDTLLPVTNWSRFLASTSEPDKPIRLKTAKLRGEYSQGLVLSLNELPENVQSLPEGSEVAQLLGIRKYEKELPAYLTGEVAGPFPNHLCSTTDEENLLSNPELHETLRGQEVTITQKLDGSSCTVVVENGKLSQVCSRRLSLKESEDSRFWKAAQLLQVEKAGSLIIQGELMGPGVQGNQLELSRHELFIFQIKRDGRFLPFEEMRSMCISIFSCQHVPLIGHSILEESFSDMQSLADRQTLPNNQPAEGIVVRAHDYRSSGLARPLGFKVINRRYRD